MYGMLYQMQRGFNPRVLAGGRDFYLVFAYIIIQFQSTRPRGRTRRFLFILHLT